MSAKTIFPSTIRLIEEEDLDLNEVPVNETENSFTGKRIDYIGNYLGMKIIFRVIENDSHLLAEAEVRHQHQVRFLPSFYGICHHSEIGSGIIISFSGARELLQATQEDSSLKKETVIDLAHLFYYFNCRDLQMGELTLSSLGLAEQKIVIQDISEILTHFIQNKPKEEKRLDSAEKDRAKFVKNRIEKIGFSTNYINRKKSVNNIDIFNSDKRSISDSEEEEGNIGEIYNSKNDNGHQLGDSEINQVNNTQNIASELENLNSKNDNPDNIGKNAKHLNINRLDSNSKSYVLLNTNNKKSSFKKKEKGSSLASINPLFIYFLNLYSNNSIESEQITTIERLRLITHILSNQNLEPSLATQKHTHLLPPELESFFSMLSLKLQSIEPQDKFPLSVSKRNSLIEFINSKFKKINFLALESWNLGLLIFNVIEGNPLCDFVSQGSDSQAILKCINSLQITIQLKNFLKKLLKSKPEGRLHPKQFLPIINSLQEDLETSFNLTEIQVVGSKHSIIHKKNNLQNVQGECDGFEVVNRTVQKKNSIKENFAVFENSDNRVLKKNVESNLAHHTSNTGKKTEKKLEDIPDEEISLIDFSRIMNTTTSVILPTNPGNHNAIPCKTKKKPILNEEVTTSDQHKLLHSENEIKDKYIYFTETEAEINNELKHLEKLCDWEIPQRRETAQTLNLAGANKDKEERNLFPETLTRQVQKENKTPITTNKINSDKENIIINCQMSEQSRNCYNELSKNSNSVNSSNSNHIVDNKEISLTNGMKKVVNLDINNIQNVAASSPHYNNHYVYLKNDSTAKIEEENIEKIAESPEIIDINMKSQTLRTSFPEDIFKIESNNKSNSREQKAEELRQDSNTPFSPFHSQEKGKLAVNNNPFEDGYCVINKTEDNNVEKENRKNNNKGKRGITHISNSSEIIITEPLAKENSSGMKLQLDQNQNSINVESYKEVNDDNGNYKEIIGFFDSKHEEIKLPRKNTIDLSNNTNNNFTRILDITETEDLIDLRIPKKNNSLDFVETLVLTNRTKGRELNNSIDVIESNNNNHLIADPEKEDITVINRVNYTTDNDNLDALFTTKIVEPELISTKPINSINDKKGKDLEAKDQKDKLHEFMNLAGSSPSTNSDNEERLISNNINNNNNDTKQMNYMKLDMNIFEIFQDDETEPNKAKDQNNNLMALPQELFIQSKKEEGLSHDLNKIFGPNEILASKNISLIEKLEGLAMIYKKKLEVKCLEEIESLVLQLELEELDEKVLSSCSQNLWNSLMCLAFKLLDTDSVKSHYYTSFVLFSSVSTLYPSDNLKAAYCLFHYGIAVKEFFSDFTHSQKYLEECISLLTKAGQLNSKMGIQAKYYLGSLFDDMGLSEESFVTLLEVLKLQKATYGDEYNLVIGKTYNCLGICEDNRKNLRKAMFYYKEAYSIFKKCSGGVETTDCAKALNNIAGIYYIWEDYNKCYSIYSQVLTIYLQFYGNNNVFTAMAFNNLGNSLTCLKSFDKAEKEFKKAIEIYSHLLGDKNIQTAMAQKNLGDLYYYLDKRYLAKERFLICMEIFKEKYGGDSDMYLNIRSKVSKLS